MDTYYSLQDYRIASANQARKLNESEEPSAIVAWLENQMEMLENQIKSVLDKWSAAQHMGAWAREIVGIGPVISAGLLANIDIRKAPTVGHIWRFAGLDPTCKWERKQKRPWNASLKRLCWLIGESFVKVSGHKNDIYGKLYLQRKEYERQQNEAGAYVEQAKSRLESMRVKNTPEAKGIIAIFETGKLLPIALHERSKRWTVKLFLAHWHEEAYRHEYGSEPPMPYPLAHLGHAHKI